MDLKKKLMDLHFHIGLTTDENKCINLFRELFQKVQVLMPAL